MTAHSAQQQDYPRLEAILDAVARWITKYRQAVDAQEEFQQCGRDEVARIAHDLGVTPDQLAEVAGKGPDSAALLGKMLVALGVDAKRVADGEPGVMRDLQRLCASCAARQQCLHEFAAGTAAEHYHEFCPNAYTLDALLQEQRQEQKH